MGGRENNLFLAPSDFSSSLKKVHNKPNIIALVFKKFYVQPPL